MKIFLISESIGYSYPAKPKMDLEFFEDGFRGGSGNTLSVRIDRDQAHNMIRELMRFCRAVEHPLYMDIDGDACICSEDAGGREIPFDPKCPQHGLNKSS